MDATAPPPILAPDQSCGRPCGPYYPNIQILAGFPPACPPPPPAPRHRPPSCHRLHGLLPVAPHWKNTGADYVGAVLLPGWPEWPGHVPTFLGVEI